MSVKPNHEGFSQSEPFVVKRDTEIYDDFYVDIYDRLTMPEKRGDFEIQQIVANTQASPMSAFLEIGSGTGYLIHKLKTRGFQAYGIDISEPMVEHATEKYPNIQVKCGDATDPITFEKGTFSHILCMYFTIYQFPDKVAFFRNCYHWLMSNSYLVLHLVDKDKYDAIIPCGKPAIAANLQKYTDKRITNTAIDFEDFHYMASVNFNAHRGGSDVVITEKFTDRLSKNVRQNEQTLYMEPVQKILEVARYCGFILKGKIDYADCNGDSYQYLYFLEKML
jgi:SAM-dependent methyltransferase